MKITSYGLFWRASEIDWFPGRGVAGSFRLLGRIGTNRGSIKLADFRKQQGIYILYDDYGPGYIGLTRERGLGKRLKDHMEDKLAEKWGRFSWFGFNPIGSPGSDGVLSLLSPDQEVTESTHTTIGDLEALLIRAMGPKLNSSSMNFKDAEKWTQVDYDDVNGFLTKVAPKASD